MSQKRNVTTTTAGKPLPPFNPEHLLKFWRLISWDACQKCQRQKTYYYSNWSFCEMDGGKRHPGAECRGCGWMFRVRCLFRVIHPTQDTQWSRNGYQGTPFVPWQPDDQALQALEIERLATFGCHVERNGACETFNRSLVCMLLKYVDGEQKHWVEAFQYLVFA